MSAQYRGHTILKTIIGYFVDGKETIYNTLADAKLAIDQLEIKRRTR